MVVRNEMSTSDWPTKTGDMAKLVKAVPERFTVDLVTKYYRLIHTTAAPLGFPITDRGADMERVADEGFRIVTSPAIMIWNPRLRSIVAKCPEVT